MAESVFSIVIRIRRTFLSVSYDYVFSELFAFTVNGCFGRLMRLILKQAATMTWKKHLIMETSMFRKKSELSVDEKSSKV